MKSWGNGQYADQGTGVASQGVTPEVTAMNTTHWFFLFALFLSSFSAQAALECTAESPYVASQLKFCTFRIGPDVARGTPAAEQAAMTDSVEIQFYRDPSPRADAETAPYMRVLIHNENCTEMGYGGRQIVAARAGKAPVCFVGWVSRAEYDTIKERLYTLYNEFWKSIMFGGDRGASAILGWVEGAQPSLYAGTVAIAIGVPLVITLNRIAQFGYDKTKQLLSRVWAAISRSRRGRAAVAATGEDAVAALGEAEVRATRLSRMVSPRGLTTGGLTAMGGLLAYIYIIQPMYEANRDAFRYESWLAWGHKFAQYLTGELIGMNFCMLTDNASGNASDCLNHMSRAAGSAMRDLSMADASEPKVEDLLKEAANSASQLPAQIAGDVPSLTAAEAAMPPAPPVATLVELNPPAGRPLVVRPLRVDWDMDHVRAAWKAYFRPACNDVTDASSCNTRLTYDRAGFYHRAVDVTVSRSLRDELGH